MPNNIAIVYLETGFQQNIISVGFLILFDKDGVLADYIIVKHFLLNSI